MSGLFERYVDFMTKNCMFFFGLIIGYGISEIAFGDILGVIPLIIGISSALMIMFVRRKK